MTLTFYRLIHLQADNKKSLFFETTSARETFFNSQTTKLTLTGQGYLKDQYSLYNSVVVYNISQPNIPNMYNYVKVTDNTTSSPLYFYILDYRELGNQQLEYLLKLDTVVSFVQGATSPINLTLNKHLVQREHKPRFNFNTNRALYHSVPEAGDNTTPKVINETAYTGTRAARLVYKNRTDSKPVAYPYVETPLSVNVQGSDWIGTVYSQLQDINTDETMYIWDGDFEYTLGEGVPNTSIAVPSTQYVKYIRSTSGHRTLSTYLKSDGTVVNTNILTVTSGKDLKIKVGNQSVQLLLAVDEYVPPGRTWDYLTTNFAPINYAATSTKNLPLWSEIDQYDAMTDRIVEVPYFVAHNLTFYEDGYGIFINLESMIDVQTSELPLKDRPTGTFDMSRVDKNKVIGNDPKLYTSQFAPSVYSFNGAVIGVKRERLNKENGLAATNSMRARFFASALTPSTFNLEIQPLGSVSYEREEDNELRASWDVNNEIASIKDEAYTYNQYYKDLDDKQRRIQESAAFRNTVLNSVNQVLGVTGGLIAGADSDKGLNPLVVGARAGMAGINIAQMWADYADQLKLNEIQAKQKYIGMLLSSSQISGASLDFIKTFDGDKIRLINFGLTGHEFDYWDTFFHKYGYQTLEYKKVTFRTRRYWDYKQMVLDEVETSAYITEEIKDDVKKRFAEGITLFHAQGDNSVDWYQTKENWEI